MWFFSNTTNKKLQLILLPPPLVAQEVRQPKKKWPFIQAAELNPLGGF